MVRLFGSFVIILHLLSSFIIPYANSELRSELLEEFDEYRECLEKYEKTIGNEQKIRVIHAIRGSDVILPCFPCVSPEDGVEIDSTYKPSAGKVGRAMHSVVDFFKQKFLRSTNALPDKNRWKYDWEFAMIGRGFVPLSSMHFSTSESISDRIQRFISKDDAEIQLGDRYELVLKDVNVKSTGYYRCINRHGRSAISSMYFVEVSNEKQIIQLHGEVGKDTIPKEVDLKSGEFQHAKLKYSVKASDWSKCSYCSSERGEETRTIKCYLEQMVSFPLVPPAYRHLALFQNIECSSTLIPLEMRKKLRKMGNHRIFLETRPCYKECTSFEQVNRMINKTEELGDFRSLDYIPGGEFLFGDLLPRLLPPVVRKVQLIIEDDPLVLTCQKLIDLNSGVHWYSLKHGPLQHNGTLEIYKGRAYFDEETNLVFEKFTIEDDDEYFCYSSNNILLATFHIRVVENDKNEQVIEIVRIFVKFVAFVLIFSLIANQLFR